MLPISKSKILMTDSYVSFYDFISVLIPYWNDIIENILYNIYCNI